MQARAGVLNDAFSHICNAYYALPVVFILSFWVCNFILELIEKEYLIFLAVCSHGSSEVWMDVSGDLAVPFHRTHE